MCILGRCIIQQCSCVSAGVCICMHRCWDRAGSSLIIGSTQDTMKSGSKSGSYQVGSLEQVLQVRSFCGLSTRARNVFWTCFCVSVHRISRKLKEDGCYVIIIHYVLSPKLLSQISMGILSTPFCSVIQFTRCMILIDRFQFISRQGTRHSMDMSCTFHSKVVEITANSQSLYFETLILCISLLSLSFKIDSTTNCLICCKSIPRTTQIKTTPILLPSPCIYMRKNCFQQNS